MIINNQLKQNFKKSIIYSGQRTLKDTTYVGSYSFSPKQGQLNIEILSFHSIFCQKVSYHFIVERDYCKLNFAYQRYRFLKENSIYTSSYKF